MSNIAAIVKSLVGQVFAVSVDGFKRQIFEGERLMQGEQVITSLGGEVVLQLSNGETVALAGNSSWQAEAPTADETARSDSASELEQALAAGFDPTTELEATAAGPGAGGSGGAAGGGHSFVMLDTVGGQVDAEIGFETNAASLTGTSQDELLGLAVTSTSTTGVIDNTPPAAPTLTLLIDSGVAGDGITNTGTYTVGGTESGALVEYSTDGTTWSTTAPVAVEGSNTIHVRQTDVAGNVSGSSTLTFTLDTQVVAPTISLDSDSGVAGDSITNSGAYSIGGTESGALVEYSIDGTTWSTTAPVATEGSNTIQVRQTDVAGNVSAPSTLTFTLDTQVSAPTISLDSDTGSSTSDGITNSGAYSIGGTESGALVEYSIDGTTWSTTAPVAVEGSNTIHVRQTDVAGNISGSSTLTFTLDTQVAAPTISLDNDTGSSTNDGITNSGAYSIGGTEPGALVEYSTDGTTWSTTAPAATEGSNTIQVRQTDVAGNVSGSSTLTFTLDTQVAAPTISLDNDSGVAGDGITNTGTYTVGGTESGALVEYSTDGSTWSTTAPVAVEGSNTIQVRQTDVAGNVSGSSSLTFTLDTQVAAPTISLDSDTGVAGDNVTNSGAYSVSGTESGALIEYSTDGTTWSTTAPVAVEGSNTIHVRQTDVAGNVSASSTLTFTLDTQVAAPTISLDSDSGVAGDNVTNSGAYSVGGTESGALIEYSTDGTTWSTTAPVAVEGSNTIHVRQTDVAGNVSASSSLTFTLDTQVAAPTISLDSDTGSSTNDGITNSGTYTVGGTESGALVEYSTDGTTWSTTAPVAVEGSNTIHVRQTDVAGNVSASSTLTFTLDTQVAAPTISLDNDSGVAGDSITNTGTYTVSGTETGALVEYSTDGTTWSTTAPVAVEGSNTIQVRQTDVAGNVSGSSTLTFTLDTQVAAPTINLDNDSGVAGDSITNNGAYSVGGTESGALVEYSTDGSTWSTTAPVAVEGSNTIQVRQTDVAGNVSGSSSLTFTLDTQVAAPTISLDSDTGVAGDNVTNTGTYSIGGTESGALVEYSTDGTTWSTTAPVAIEGSNTIYVRQTDVAGNVSASSSLTFTLDTQVAAPTISLDSDTGSNTSDGITSSGAYTIGGTESGALVEYSTDGTTWSTTAPVAVEGSNTIQVRQTDVAGNVSGSSTLTFTLDTQVAAPTITLDSDTGSSTNDGITNSGTYTVGGTESGALVEYSTDGSTWSTTAPVAVEGSNTIHVRQTDVAGNVSGSSTLTFTLDTQVAAPTISLDSDTGSSTSDGITNSGAYTVGGTESGALVEYSTDGTTWSTTAPVAVEGSNTIHVRQTDVAGNVSGSSSLTFTLDTQVAAPTISLDNDSGVAGDSITNNGAYTVGGTESGALVEYSTDGTTWSTTAPVAVEGSNTIHVRQTDVAGNVSGSSSLTFTLDTQVAAPTITLDNDTGVAGDNVTNSGTYSIGGTESGALVEYSTDGTTWSTTAPVAVEGSNTIHVRQTDVAGNVSGSSSLTFTLDTQVAAPTISLDSDTGSNTSDGITSSGAYTIGGTESGAQVEYSTDGSTWSTTAPVAVEGSNTIQVRQTDVAGNVSGFSTLTFTLDTQVAAPTISLDNDSGVAGDNVTNTGTYTVGGTESGALVEYSTDGTTWSTTAPVATEGSNTIQVRQTDVAGNVSGSSSLTFTLDTTNPTVAISTTDSNLSVGETTTLTFTFSEAVTGFTASDISASGGTVNNLVQSTDNPAVWTATFTSTGGGSPSVSVAAGSYNDLAGNAGNAGNLALNSDPIASNDHYLVSGLVGQYFGYNEGPDGANLTNLNQVEAFISGRAATATFTATNLNYGSVTNLGNDTNLPAFLKGDASSLSHTPTNTSDAIVKLNGVVNLAAGTYQFRVTADDGYSIRINGQTVAEYNGNQSTTSRESLTFTIAEGGAQQIEIVYWDQGGFAQLTVELRPQGGSYSVLGGSALQHENPALVTNEDQALSINPAALLGNDTDPDGNPLSIVSVQDATHGTVALVGGNVVFTPDANYNGPATFTYTVSDGLGGLSTATVTVGIKAVNDVPVAVNDSATTNEDTPVTLNVLANDTDVDGDILTVTGATASHGSVLVNADNTLTFTPATNFSGPAVINYTISDGKGGTASAQATVTVVPQADAPLISPVANIFVLNPGATVISTGSSDVAINTSAANAGDGISRANLEAELGLPDGFLNGRFNPTGPNVNHNGNVTVLDGKVTHSDHSMASGTTVNWNYAFTNGENDASEVQSGYNDLVVLIVTGPDGSRETFLVDSSESKFPNLTSNGSFSYTATQDGNYSFSWLVLNGRDSAKDSSLSLSKASFNQAGSGTTYAAPIALSLFAQLADQDGSESLSLVLSGLPTGASLSAGVNNGDGSWALMPGDLSNLHLLPPAGFTGTLNLTLTGTSTETANGHTASSSQSFNVTISETTNTLTDATAANNTLTGTNANDLIRGYAGNDNLSGGNGDDLIYGGAGNDTLNGGLGNDHLYGGVGNDTLNGDGGNDYLNGGAGNDILNGGAGDDILRGGLGDDRLTGGTGADLFLWQRGDLGRDTVLDFNYAQGDRIDLHDLLQGENDSNILNYLRVDTSTSTLLISTTGVLNASGNNADVTIKLENGGNPVNLNPANLNQTDLIHSLIAGADPMIKVDHT